MRNLLQHTSTACRYCLLATTILFLCACRSPNTEPTIPTAPAPPVAIQDLDITTGQTVYVPAYAKIYHTERGQTLDLTVTLSIHNTDLTHPIVITSVRYYNAHGAFIREYLDNPLQLEPLGTADFLVESSNTANDGIGTNFIVEWGAEQPVYEPIIETIMIHTGTNQGISFTSPGRVIDQIEPGGG